jgi:protein TonB
MVSHWPHPDRGFFPLLGEFHPLRRRAQTILVGALFCASFVHVAFWGYVGFGSEREPRILSTPTSPRSRPHNPMPEPIPRRPHPPSLPAPVLPKIGVPEPVPDFLAEAATVAPDSVLSVVLELGSDVGDGSGSSVVVADPPGAEPIFTHAEVLPELVTMPSPIYPELARLADVEGTVLIRALIGRDGFVKEVGVVRGVPMLNEAALVAIRGARFRPALQQHRPVAVWFVVPVRFTLR